MRLKRILTLALTLALAFTSGSALASTITTSSEHTITFSLDSVATSGRLWAQTSVDGYAQYLPQEYPGGVTVQQYADEGTNSVTASASLPASTWLNLTSASVTASRTTSSLISSNFQGTGPVALGNDSSNDGKVSQSSSNSISGKLTPTATGNYTFSIKDIYSYTYSLNNNTGNLFDYARWESYITFNINYWDPELQETTLFNEDGAGLIYLQFGHTPGDYLVNIPSTTIGDEYNGSIALSLEAGKIYNFNIYINESHYGSTIPNTNPVPLPPTALLLGSGLLGMWAVRRKFRG